jgi:hypothetical protein
MPVFMEVLKKNYKEVCARATEALQRKDEHEVEDVKDDLASYRLYLQRVNRVVLLNIGKHRIAMDAMCEHINRLLIDLGQTKKIETLQKKSAMLQTLKKVSSLDEAQLSQVAVNSYAEP